VCSSDLGALNRSRQDPFLPHSFSLSAVGFLFDDNTCDTLGT
jgi:hypothetical protein